MKFIHAADLHLDSPFLGLTSLPSSLLTTVRQSTFTAATRVFDRALAEQVDFVILAGDLFDRAEQSVAAQAYLFQQFDRLNSAHIPVIISFGNHDYLADQHQTVAYPANVTTLGANVSTHTLTLNSGEAVAISGFSYPQRWVTTDQLADYPVHAATDWHIGVLHGAVATGSADHYAPFHVADMLTKRYDYWALGHIHHHQLLTEQPPILYAGNTQGRSINETGEKGAYLVTSESGRLVPQFFTTAEILWATATLRSAATDLRQLTTELTAWLTEHVAAQSTLTQLTIAGATLDGTDLASVRSGEWLTLYQRTHARQLKAAQRYLINVVIAAQPANLTAPQIDAAYWEQGAATIFAPANLQTTFGKLAQEPALAAWFAQPATRSQLTDQAQHLLAELTGKEGHDEA
ncbi:metallophosphoesterase family protein [Levilactobacillus cerevisiae]|uniref:metallophosphoesterase family protein n=1 Tax=Levilactobacillus cerevisiae TaxID=1704076 RepID=UPI000F78A70E|nr:DNA repair exonuclease [Levilactobacillus cerevisiae]